MSNTRLITHDSAMRTLRKIADKRLEHVQEAGALGASEKVAMIEAMLAGATYTEVAKASSYSPTLVWQTLAAEGLVGDASHVSP